MIVNREEKWVVASEGVCFTEEQMMKRVAFTEQYFDSEIIM